MDQGGQAGGEDDAAELPPFQPHESHGLSRPTRPKPPNRMIPGTSVVPQLPLLLRSVNPSD